MTKNIFICGELNLSISIKFLLSFFLFLTLTQDLYAVGGISNTKVIVPSTETVPSANFELEPFFGAVFTDDPTDSKNYEAGLRFTKGLKDNFEAGFNIIFLDIQDSDTTKTQYEFGDISPGVKYRFFDSGSFSVAYQGGLTIPTGTGDSNWIFEPAGLIFTKGFTQKFSMDFDAVLGFDEDDNIFLTGNAGLGCYITERFQPVLEINYIFENPDSGKNSNIASFTAGFTADLSSIATLIIGIKKDFVSENADDSFTLTSALTLIF